MSNVFSVIINHTHHAVRLYTSPTDVIRAHSRSEALQSLQLMQAALDSGKYLAGYFSYEFGYALDTIFNETMPDLDTTFPLVCFGVFDSPPQLLSEEAIDELAQHLPAYAGPLLYEWDRAHYQSRFQNVMDSIADGTVYQVNLSMRAGFHFYGNPLSLYAQLRTISQSDHNAFVDDGEYQLLSLSPELFFSIDSNNKIQMKPMKGTSARGKTTAEDQSLCDDLKTDEKTRAENVMIVDLIRNDLSRIAQPGSVHVHDLFNIETYPTLHQVTSSISAKLKQGSSIKTLVEALFPCGSVTGAPKIKAMQLINELEQSKRGAYCGAIGMFSPDGSAKFNVAIRTLTLHGQRGELGVGSGIVADSDMDTEYAECLLKARYFEQSRRPLALIETFRFENRTFIRLDRHLQRMQSSAGYFGLAFDRDRAMQTLHHAIKHYHSKTPARVRLVLNETGEFDVQISTLPPSHSHWTYHLSEKRIQSNNSFLQHKTNWRELYEQELQHAHAQGIDEVVFLNERSELCEGSRSTLFVDIDGTLYTPPLNSGVLNGCLRADMLEHRQCLERVLTQDDLRSAERVFLGNSLRGLIPAILVES